MDKRFSLTFSFILFFFPSLALALPLMMLVKLLAIFHEQKNITHFLVWIVGPPRAHKMEFLFNFIKG
jgi:hypothetical protein